MGIPAFSPSFQESGEMNINRNLFFSAITKFVLGIIGVATLLFLPAGTLYYSNGWLFLVILFVPMFLA